MSESPSTKKKPSRRELSGLYIQPGWARARIRATNPRKAAHTAVCITAFMESVLREVAFESLAQTAGQDLVILTPQHIAQAVESNAALRKMFPGRFVIERKVAKKRKREGEVAA